MSRTRRTKLTILRRRKLATTRRISRAATIAGGTGGASASIGIVAVALLTVVIIFNAVDISTWL